MGTCVLLFAKDLHFYRTFFSSELRPHMCVSVNERTKQIGVRVICINYEHTQNTKYMHNS